MNEPSGTAIIFTVGAIFFRAAPARSGGCPARLAGSADRKSCHCDRNHGTAGRSGGRPSRTAGSSAGGDGGGVREACKRKPLLALGRVPFSKQGRGVPMSSGRAAGSERHLARTGRGADHVGSALRQGDGLPGAAAADEGAGRVVDLDCALGALDGQGEAVDAHRQAAGGA